MKIHSYAKTYDVNFYNDFSFVDELFALPNKLVVVDKNVYSLYKEEIFSKLPQNELFLIEAIEENKIIECALSLCSRMTEIPAKKNANLISFGGGIIQDIT
ncbi:MAG: 3-dehydroquinate synthase, partial [Bacillota bacterium]|nr:3-dehydroquinate synthase [Bacillota bacterium]